MPVSTKTIIPLFILKPDDYIHFQMQNVPFLQKQIMKTANTRKNNTTHNLFKSHGSTKKKLIYIICPVSGTGGSLKSKNILKLFIIKSSSPSYKVICSIQELR